MRRRIEVVSICVNRTQKATLLKDAIGLKTVEKIISCVYIAATTALPTTTVTQMTTTAPVTTTTLVITTTTEEPLPSKQHSQLHS